MAEFLIRPQGPFSWRAALEMLASWPPMSHFGEAGSDPLRMAFLADGSFTPVAVALQFDGDGLHGEVAGCGDGEVVAVTRQVARIFSLEVDASGYGDIAQRDPAIGAVMEALPGLRPALFPSPYECAAWGVLSQRLGMRQGARIKLRMVQELGDQITVAGASVGCFPSPQRLAGLDALVGLSDVKVARLRGIATAATEGKLDAERLRQLEPAQALAGLQLLPGIGDFWAKGIYLRSCGITDFFPEEPLAVRALEALHNLPGPPTGDTLAAITEVYRPWRMWVCVLLRVAVGRGLIAGVDPRYQTGDVDRSQYRKSRGG